MSEARKTVDDACASDLVALVARTRKECWPILKMVQEGARSRELHGEIVGSLGNPLMALRSVQTGRKWYPKHRGEATVYHTFMQGEYDWEGNRYIYDLTRCPSSEGWNQYDTKDDAHYFGMWYHAEHRIIVTYGEGDETVVICHTEAAWRAELSETAELFGDPPPAYKAIETAGPTAGQVTHYFDEKARPEVT